jgi:hypothetical protein
MAISADAKLARYNGALFRLGLRALANLSEAREPRRVLDGFWGAQNDLVSYALERGDWNFAIRARQLESDTAVEPAWGWGYAYSKPEDFRRLSKIASDDRLQNRLTAREYADEAGYWLCDLTELFVAYVSDDTDYGFNSGIWPKGFTDYLETRLAFLACNRLTNDKQLRREMEAEMNTALKNAKSVDAMAEGVKFLPKGGWASSRSQRMDRSRDRSRSLL